MQICLRHTWFLLLLVGCSQTDKSLEADYSPPLIIAAEKGDLSTLTQLITQQTPIDVRDECRWTPLMKAALNGHQEAVRQLIAAGAAIDLKDKGGYTAMMLAASNNHFEMVELLISAGANVDQTEDTSGWTALIWAAKQGHFETVKTLLAHGANPDLPDMQGKRAIDWAQRGNSENITTLLASTM